MKPGASSGYSRLLGLGDRTLPVHLARVLDGQFELAFAAAPLEDRALAETCAAPRRNRDDLRRVAPAHSTDRARTPGIPELEQAVGRREDLRRRRALAGLHHERTVGAELQRLTGRKQNVGARVHAGTDFVTEVEVHPELSDDGLAGSLDGDLTLLGHQHSQGRILGEYTQGHQQDQQDQDSNAGAHGRDSSGGWSVSGSHPGAQARRARGERSRIRDSRDRTLRLG